MTADEFRRLALGVPGAVESSHNGHPDFRVAGRIFASLGPAEGRAMVNLTPEHQAEFVGESPGTFEPSTGAWGARGYTRVLLAEATAGLVERALAAAWEKTREKPKRGGWRS